MSERPDLLERLLSFVGLGSNGRSAADAPAPPHDDGLPPGCGDVEDVSCEEAARQVYEYLDGELEEEDAEAIRCHVEQCRRCYPMYNWEQIFLETLRERAERPESSDELRRKVARILDEEAG
ncbi:MAG: zf-HC2 domain-containing protein [Gemmatimonadota bacterium]